MENINATIETEECNGFCDRLEELYEQQYLDGEPFEDICANCPNKE